MGRTTSTGGIISQQDIANALGVSIATISRVLSGKADLVRCVAPETVKKVRDTAARLGYRMNFAGRMLRTKRTNAVGLLFSSKSPFYLEIVPELQRRLFKRGYSALCGFWTTEEDAGPTISAIVERDVDGIITCHWPDVMRRLAGGIPTVFYLGHDSTLDCVNPAERIDVLLAHLVEMGHRHVLLFGNWRDVRFPGLEVESFETAREFPPERHGGLVDAAEAFFARRKAARRPSAVVCAGEYTAATLAALLMRIGLRVPEEVSIVGTSVGRAYATAVPPITTFGVNAEAVADALVETLFRRLANSNIEPQQVFIEPTFSLRSSCRCKRLTEA